MVRRYTIPGTLNSSGAGTFFSQPVAGEVLAVRLDGTAWQFGGSIDLTLTGVNTGGTFLAVTNQTLPIEYHPRPIVHETDGSTIGTALESGLPADEGLQLVVAQGDPDAVNTMHVLVREN